MILILSRAEHDLDVVLHDIKTAFPYSDLQPNEDIYLRRPTGFTDNIMPHIVKLKKCLYGVPQASKYFDGHLSSDLLAMAFIRCISDAEVFSLPRGGKQVIMSKHVDDCLLAATRGSKILSFVQQEFEKSYQLTANVEPTNFSYP